jgi:hypothetical protein
MAAASALIAVAAAGCSGPGARPASGKSPSPGASATSGTAAITLPQASLFASPSSTVSRPNGLTGPPADPFTGTPADNWADGADGIVLPAARSHGRFTAAQVESAYQTTRKLLIAADLDRKTLLGGAPTAYANLLTPREKTEFLGALNSKGVDKNGDTKSTRRWVMSFAPGTIQLIGSVIKVRGSMRARATTVQGEQVLAIDVDYIFVYPIEPPAQPARWMRVVTQVSGQVFFGYWAGTSSPFTPWVYFGQDIAGVKCGSPDGYIYPAFPGGPQDTASPTGSPVDPYATNSAPPVGGCQAVTGT